VTLNGPVSCVSNADWQVYMILCSDGSLYTGITTQVDRRFAEHAAGRGARFFRGRRPLRVVYLESGHSRSSAACREYAIKQMSRSAKHALIEGWTLDSPIADTGMAPG